MAVCMGRTLAVTGGLLMGSSSSLGSHAVTPHSMEGALLSPAAVLSTQ